VVSDRPLRDLERVGELGRAGRPLVEEGDDACPRRLGDCAEPLGLLDREDVVELVVG
jgi:hypothetical protein